MPERAEKKHTRSSKRGSLQRAASPIHPPSSLHAEIRELILSARNQVAQAVNAGLTMLYRQVGDRIRREILKEKRAESGADIVSALGRQLEQEFGRGFSEKSLRRIIQFAEVFPDQRIVVSLIRELSFTHFIALIPLRDPLPRHVSTSGG